jgi:Cdc6-like AAA superfamily ATPase
MLPAKPQIFRGRGWELSQIVQMLSQGSARISILGPGGIGKTALAKAALHHPEITAKYRHQFFVACESATTSLEIAALIGAHVGLEPGKDLTKPVLRWLSDKPVCLLILDNLETAWEPFTSRNHVEELLSLLTEISHLSLMVSIFFSFDN